MYSINKEPSVAGMDCMRRLKIVEVEVRANKVRRYTQVVYSGGEPMAIMPQWVVCIIKNSKRFVIPDTGHIWLGKICGYSAMFHEVPVA